MLLEMGASTILYFKAEASYILQTLTAFVPYHKGTATTTLELVTGWLAYEKTRGILSRRKVWELY